MKIVPFDTIGLFMGVHLISLCGASQLSGSGGRMRLPCTYGLQGTWFFTGSN